MCLHQRPLYWPLKNLILSYRKPPPRISFFFSPLKNLKNSLCAFTAGECHKESLYALTFFKNHWQIKFKTKKCTTTVSLNIKIARSRLMLTRGGSSSRQIFIFQSRKTRNRKNELLSFGWRDEIEKKKEGISIYWVLLKVVRVSATSKIADKRGSMKFYTM